jgi:hypothetical protein
MTTINMNGCLMDPDPKFGVKLRFVPSKRDKLTIIFNRYNMSTTDKLFYEIVELLKEEER